MLPVNSKHYQCNLGVMEDRFDMEGYVTGFGNPDWASTHEPGTRTAPAVKVIIDASATCVGKLHMDELAYRWIFIL